MKNNYSEKIQNDLNSLYDEIDYKYDEMFDKDVNKELVGLYKELSNEMTFKYDDGPDNVKKRLKKVNDIFNEKDAPIENVNEQNNEPVYEETTSEEPLSEEPTYSEPSVKVPRDIKKEVANKKMNNKKSSSNNKPPRQPLPKQKKIILSIILTIAIGIFLVSALKLISIKKGYDDSNNTYKELDKDFFKSDDDSLNDWDFSDLFAKNPEVVGYIYCPDLISYPVVQGSDNDYYLRHLFTGEYNVSGSIFLDCNLPAKFESRNCIVYGHNMKDGSMFSKIVNYIKNDGQKFYENHKEFHIFTTDGHHYVYKVLSAYTASVASNIYTPNLNDAQFGDLLNEVQRNSLYDTEHPEINLDSKIITLSTCLDNLDDAYRHVLILVRDREIPKSEQTNTQPTTTVDE